MDDLSRGRRRRTGRRAGHGRPEGSLACWCSSLLLLASAGAATAIYSVRRHRIDDYQGKYRVWLWAAVGCFILATDQAVGLREAFRDLMTAATGTPLLGNGDLWWVVAYAIIFGAIGSRVLLDARSCIAAATAVFCAAVAHAAIVAQRLGWTPLDGETAAVMFRVGGEMTGNLLLLTGLLLFARHVIFDAEGLLPARYETDPVEEEDDDQDRLYPAGKGRWRKIDPPHVVPAPSHQWPASPAPVASPAVIPAAPSASQPPVARKLTKAERKALKKRLLREREERERRAG